MSNDTLVSIAVVAMGAAFLLGDYLQGKENKNTKAELAEVKTSGFGGPLVFQKKLGSTPFFFYLLIFKMQIRK